MKKIIHLTLALMLCAMMIAFLPSMTEAATTYSGSCGTNATWTLSNGTLTISGSGDMTDYAAVADTPWNSYIGSITKVTVNSGITSIGKYAFARFTALTSVSLPTSLTKINYGSLCYCTSLSTINIPASVTSIGENVFYNSTALKTVRFKGKAPSIGSGIFKYMSNTTVYYPSGDSSWTESVRQQYGGTNITWTATSPDLSIITQPKDCTVAPGQTAQFSIGTYPTSSVSYQWYYQKPGETTWTAVSNNGTSATYSLKTEARHNGYKYKCVATYGSKTATSSVATLTVKSGDCGANGDNVTWALENGTLTISGSGAMKNYSSSSKAPWYDSRSSITKVVINAGVTNVGNYAFYYCTALTSVTIPSSVTSIGSYAFRSCRELTSITIPSSVTSIGEGVFSGCSSLTSITIPSSVTSIDYYAFNGCSSLTSITIPSSVTSIGYSAFGSCGLTSITIPSSVTSIDSYAFENCIKLTSITIPSSVTSIGGGVFAGCSSLLKIQVASGNANYVAVDGVLFTKDKKAILQYPAGKSGSAYSIPSSVTSIGNSAFNGCSSLTSITIPSSVTSIGVAAFDSCSRLTSITIPSGVKSIDSGTFSYCYSLTSITIPSSVTSIGYNAFYNCSSLTSITIPSSVTGIGPYAFSGCSKLTSITIPSSVTSIDYCAFSRSGLKAVEFLGDPPTISSDAFQSVTSNAYYPKNNSNWTEDKMQNYGGTLTWAQAGEKPVIVAQPKKAVVRPGETASFSFVVTGGGLSYQWYYKKPGESSWSKVSAASGKTATYSLTAEERHDGYQYKCVASNSGGSVTSNAVKLIVANIPVVSQTGTMVLAAEGETVSFTVTAQGSDLVYEWWYINEYNDEWPENGNFSSFADMMPYMHRVINNGKSATYSLTAAPRHDWNFYVCCVWYKDNAGDYDRCAVGGGYYLWVVPNPTITQQPSDVAVNAGETATFTIAAGNTLTYGDYAETLPVEYQWYYQKPGSSTWTAVNADSGKTAEYSLTAETRHDGYKYRCVVSTTINAYGDQTKTAKTTSKTVTLTIIKTPTITTEPKNASVAVGKTATFTVEAAGGALTYQWYYKKPGESSWSKVSAASGKTATYSLTVEERHNGYQYKCLVKNTAGQVYSKAVALTTGYAPTITTQPTNKTVTAGKTATFKVVASGENLTYQWYYQKPGETTWNAVLNNGTSATYSLTTAARHNGYKYKCLVKNAFGEVYSKVVTLTVNN